MTQEEYTYLNEIINGTTISNSNTIINESFGALDAVINGIGLVLAPFTGGMSIPAAMALDVALNGVTNAASSNKDDEWKKMNGEFIGTTFKLPWVHTSVPAAKAKTNWNPLAYAVGDDVKRMSSGTLEGAAQAVANEVSKIGGTLGMDILTNSVDDVLSRKFLVSASYMGANLSNLETQIVMTYSKFIQSNYPNFYAKLMPENISNIAGFWGLNANHMCQVAKIQVVAPKVFNFPDEHAEEAQLIGGEQNYTDTNTAIAQYQEGDENIDFFPQTPEEQEGMFSLIEKLDEQTQIDYLANYILNQTENNIATSTPNTNTTTAPVATAQQQQASQINEGVAGGLLKWAVKKISTGLGKKATSTVAKKIEKDTLEKGAKEVAKGASRVINKEGQAKARRAIMQDFINKGMKETSVHELNEYCAGLTAKQIKTIMKAGPKGCFATAKKMAQDNLKKGLKKEAFNKLLSIQGKQAAVETTKKTMQQVVAKHPLLKPGFLKLISILMKGAAIVGVGAYGVNKLKNSFDNAVANGYSPANAGTGSLMQTGGYTNQENGTANANQEPEDFVSAIDFNDNQQPQNAQPQNQATTTMNIPQRSSSAGNAQREKIAPISPVGNNLLASAPQAVTGNNSIRLAGATANMGESIQQFNSLLERMDRVKKEGSILI